MRALLFSAITGDSALLAKIPADRWIQAGAVDEPPARPFAVIRMIDVPPSISKAPQPSLQIWVHDDRGSYIQVDAILEMVKSTLSAAVPMEDATHRIVSVEWSGDSPDLVDEGYNTNTRYAGFVLTGRK